MIRWTSLESARVTTMGSARGFDRGHKWMQRTVPARTVASDSTPLISGPSVHQQLVATPTAVFGRWRSGWPSGRLARLVGGDRVGWWFGFARRICRFVLVDSKPGCPRRVATRGVDVRPASTDSSDEVWRAAQVVSATSVRPRSVPAATMVKASCARPRVWCGWQGAGKARWERHVRTRPLTLAHRVVKPKR